MQPAFESLKQAENSLRLPVHTPFGCCSVGLNTTLPSVRKRKTVSALQEPLDELSSVLNVA